MESPERYKTLIYQKSTDGVALLRLNRPKKMNALNIGMRDELRLAAKAIAADAEVKALIITGSGRAFCAGGDVQTMPGTEGIVACREYLQKFQELVLTLAHLEKPVITAVNGYALGAGWNLALLGDIVIAADNAKFGQAFVNVGLVPDLGGLFTLPRTVGLLKAKELVLNGKMIGAHEAQRIGAVSYVVPLAELEATARAQAAKLAQAPTRALAMAKKLLNQSFETCLPQLLDLEVYAQSTAMVSADFQEGVQAFIEKREAKFSGK